MKVVFNKGEKAYTCETDSLPQVSRDYLMQYGWDQSLQDCIAGLAKAVTAARQKAGDSMIAVKMAVDEAIEKKLQKRMDSIIAGTMNIPQPRDPLRTLAAEYVAKALTKKKAQVTKERFAELVAEKMVSSRDFLVTELARRDAAEGFDVDLTVKTADPEATPATESEVAEVAAVVELAETAKKKGGKK